MKKMKDLASFYILNFLYFFRYPAQASLKLKREDLKVVRA